MTEHGKDDIPSFTLMPEESHDDLIGVECLLNGEELTHYNRTGEPLREIVQEEPKGETQR